MSKLCATSPVVLVFRLAWFAVGLLSVPLSASAVEIPVLSVTNVVFTTYEEAESFRTNSLAAADSLVVTSSYLRTSVDNSARRLEGARAAVSSLESLVNSSQDLSSSERTQLLSSLHLLDLQIASSEASLTNSLPRQVSEVESEALYIQSVLSQPLATYQIVVNGGSGDGEPSGCQCPDYTSYIDDLESTLSDLLDASDDIIDILEQDVVTSLSSIASCLNNLYSQWFGDAARWDNDVTWTVDMLWNFFSNADWYSYGSFANDRYEGAYIGRQFGTAVSNLVDAVHYLDLYTHAQGGIFHDTPPQYGPAYLREIWAYLFRPYAQLLADYQWSDNAVINGFRSFYNGTSRYMFPTNTPSRPLYVSFSAENPFFVAFTNQVVISDDSLKKLSLAFTNATDLSQLEHMVFTVVVSNTQDLATAILDEQDRRLEEALSEVKDGLKEPGEETTSLPTTSFAFGSSIGSSLRSVASSYSAMFNSIPDEPPFDIMLWQGGNFGPVEIPSVHWKPRNISGLSSIRALFSFAWYVLYIALIFVSAAIDLMVCGVIVYMVYGLLLGKPEVAYKGMLWCYKTLCVFLGYKPQSPS